MSLQASNYSDVGYIQKRVMCKNYYPINMTPREPRYTGRFRHVNSFRTINILLLNHELLEFHELVTTTDGMDFLDF